jgi:hypothetical protein
LLSSISLNKKQFHQYQKKQTITSDLKSLNTKDHETNDVGNPGAHFGQAHQGGSVKPVNEIPTFLVSLFRKAKRVLVMITVKNQCRVSAVQKSLTHFKT